MSRHTIKPRRPGFEIAVGWDGPMQTYFAIVYNHKRPEEENPVVWLGGTHREVDQPEDMILTIADFAELKPETIAQLRQDRLDYGDAPHSPLQTVFDPDAAWR